MEKNGITVTGTSEVIAMLNPVDDRKRLYHVEGRKQFSNYSQAPVIANAVYQWKIKDDFMPFVFWIYEANVNTNRTFRWAIVNPEGQKVFDVTLTAANFTVLGNTLYWVFPTAVIEAESSAFFTSNVALTGMNVIGTFCHQQDNISAVTAAAFP